jgi:4-carboxymuconolactone decarboxylase
MTDDKNFERGMKVRREVLGEEHVNSAETSKTPFDSDFQRFITETAWGSVWTRTGLDHRTRHLITLAMLAALGREHELALHIRATQNTGVTQEELKEVFMQVAIYAGVPAANTAFSVAKSVYAELSGKEADDGRISET